jgi:hypothetical protein
MLKGMVGTRTFVLVVAHPDDDAYGMADTVALHHIAVGAATDAAFRRFTGTGRPGFMRLLHRSDRGRTA